MFAEHFMELYTKSDMPLSSALYHSIEANLLDALGILPSRIIFDRHNVITLCRNQVYLFNLQKLFVQNIVQNID